jgi:hypothetical protein
MRLTRTTATHAATLTALRTGQLGRFAQARCHITQAGDFHLRLGRTRTGIAMEDFQNHHGAVHHFAANGQLQIARL